MNTFKHVEDYLEILGNYRELNGQTPGGMTIFGLSTPAPINLARYDVNIVESMASHTINNGSLTDKQSALALKLVEKYRRQFANKGVDVTPIIQNPLFRNPIRIIDRSKTIKLDNKKIIVRFPYEKDLVNEITSAAKEAKGQCHFDRENKFWSLALTEYNLNWAVVFGKKYEFVIGIEITELMDMIMKVEETGYHIQLTVKDQEVQIINAAASLIDYIETHLGGLSVSNLTKLVDYASVLGYSVDPDVLYALRNEYDPITMGIMTNRESHIMRTDPSDSGADVLNHIINYSGLVDRWPIYIYEPDTSFHLRNSAKAIFKKEEILDMTHKKITDKVDLTGIKCVYFNKSKKGWQQRIPLLLSTNAMFYGGDKQVMLQLAEKIVFYTATTYNKEATKIVG